MPLNRALICAYEFDAAGTARALDAPGVEAWMPNESWAWIHLDRTIPETEQWMTTRAKLDPLVVEALLAEETRPRSDRIGDGMLVILRGVNLNPGADPEDMISVRVWVDRNLVITMRRRKLMAIQDLREKIDRGDVPKSPGSFVVRIADHLLDRMDPVLEGLNDAVDEIEEHVLEAPSHELRTRLSRLRRQAIALRRFLAPQREMVARLETDEHPVFSESDRKVIRELADRLTRYVEGLDSARERAAVTQEELSGRMSDQLNRNTYVLSIVAGVFLPLGLLTGLLGMNVGGIPGIVGTKWGFGIVCGALVALAGVSVWVFKRLRLM